MDHREQTDFRSPRVPRGTVVVAEQGKDGLAQFLLDGRHELHADEPFEAGGRDLGPDPYELLMMALGACTSMTVRMFARRRNWPLDRIVVQLAHSRTHARDCENCADTKSFIDHIDVLLVLEGPLDQQQRAQLKAIAEKCPVHKTLSSAVDMNVALAAFEVQHADIDTRLDEALTLTFPASDPTAVMP